MLEKVSLGKSGIKVSKLGFGTGTHGISGASVQTNLGADKFVKLLRYAYDKGISYWDTADSYGCHHYIADTLRGMNRSDVVIGTKTDSKTPMSVTNDINRFMSELRVNYLDILLLHCVVNENWLEDYKGAIEVLKEAKQNGLVKAIGISCHSFNVLQRVVEADWVDVLLARLNYASSFMDASPDKVIPVLQQIHDQGKGTVIMKVLGDGELAQDPEKAINFISELSCVDAIIIGMMDENQVNQNVQLVENVFTKVG
ncbi:MAG TPA: aldo/keto reductase [Clostridia bacterium]